MTKFTIPFTSADGLKKAELTYQLYDHEIASLWRKVVERSQNLMNATFENNSQLYGKYFYKKDDISLKIHHAVFVLKEAFPEEWNDSLFEPIRENYFPINQENLNLAHSFFEKAHARMTGDSRLKTYFKELSDLNHNIHRMENILGGPEGFFVSAHLQDGVKGTIDPSWNHLFRLKQEWGEMCLGYCHVGEGYYECYLNNYPIVPTPHTHAAGDFVLNFHHQNAVDIAALQSWLNQFFKKEVNIKELPIGMVPIAKLADDYNEETILKFFKEFPMIGNQIIFHD